MKLLLISLLFQCSNLAHLQGQYYYKDSIHYRFKVCDDDGKRYMITPENIDMLVDYLESEYDTDLNLLSTDNINIWSSVIRSNGQYHELAVIAVKTETYFYFVEVVFRKFI